MAKANSPRLTEALVRELAEGETFRRGQSYYRQGAVQNLTRRGNRLTAEVEGSDYDPYQVVITLDSDGVEDAECTCPYDWGGVCKHIVATLLHYINKQEEAEERPPLDTLLAPLQAEHLRDILLTLAEEHPDLADEIEARAVALSALSTPKQEKVAGKGKQPSPSPPPPTPTPAIDPALYRRQVRNALRSADHMSSSEAYWQVGGIADEVYSVAKQALPFLEAGDGRSALAILEAVTEEYIAGWTYLDDLDGELGDRFNDLGALVTEAILTANLSPAERKKWAKRLEEWQGEVGEYGIDEAFGAAEAAIEQGWDHPPLKRILSGQTDKRAAFEFGAQRWYAEELARARLNVLERQGRTQEYLYLAEAERQVDLYLTMLVKLGRIEQAVKDGLNYLATADDAMLVAKALREHGAVEEAMHIAERGLELEGNHTGLARWLRDLAKDSGQGERALGAALAAFRERPDIADYEAISSLAGDNWPQLREELLTSLRKMAASTRDCRPFIEIFLREGLVDDALAALQADPYAGYAQREMVADAAITTHPEWVIETAWRQASEIIEGGKSGYYATAARWLERAREASATVGHSDDWRARVEDLLSRHRRKHSLTPHLQALLKRR